MLADVEVPSGPKSGRRADSGRRSEDERIKERAGDPVIPQDSWSGDRRRTGPPRRQGCRPARRSTSTALLRHTACDGHEASMNFRACPLQGRGVADGDRRQQLAAFESFQAHVGGLRAGPGPPGEGSGLGGEKFRIGRLLGLGFRMGLRWDAGAPRTSAEFARRSAGGIRLHRGNHLRGGDTSSGRAVARHVPHNRSIDQNSGPA